MKRETLMNMNLKEKSNEETALVGAYMYKSVKDKLEEIARMNGISVSNVIRTAINNLIDGEVR